MTDRLLDELWQKTHGSIRARWVFPVDSPPLENGCVEIADGRITAVHTKPDATAVDLGNVALIPGLVNAHTHLELSDVEAPLGPSAPFTAWLRSVIGHRRGRADLDQASRRAVRHGVEESAAHGTTSIGDIVSTEWDRETYGRNSPRCVAFLELLGLAEERVAGQLALARAHLSAPETFADQQPGRTGKSAHIPGLSPHAPYSVHPQLLAGLLGLAREFRSPVALHLAETRAELELLARGTGEFVEFLQGLGVWRPDVIPTGSRPLDFLQALADLERSLVIHGNYLADQELDFLEQCDRMTVVYCPRTHAYFGHNPHPWRRLLARGVNVAIGTDSRASNPDLSVWNELLFLRKAFADVPPAWLLELGTLRGARALGFAAETGSLTPGKRADLASVSLSETGTGSPAELLFHPSNRVAVLPRRA